MAEHLSYYSYDETALLECPVCGWNGAGTDADEEDFDDLFDLSCPLCEEILAVVLFPTLEETKAEAARGNPRAIADLPLVGRIEARRDQFAREHLRSAEQLPDLPGETLELDWDFDSDEGGTNARTLIRLGDRVVWSEPAIWEGTDRFFEVKEILREKYGPRFKSLTPTQRSTLYLYGDDLSWLGRDVPTD